MANRFNPDGLGDYDIVVAAWSQTGTLLWSRSYNAGSADFGNHAAADSNGDFFLVGSYQDGSNRDFIVQKWTPDGELLWDRGYGGSLFDRAERVLVVADNAYIVGNSDSSAGNTDVALSRINGDGSLGWHRTRDRGSTDFGGDIDDITSLVQGTTGVSVVGESKDTETDIFNVWKIEYNLAGSFGNGKVLEPIDRHVRYPKMLRFYDLFSGNVTYYICGLVDNGEDDELFLSLTDGAGDAINHFTVGLPDSMLVTDMISSNRSSLFICGFGLFNAGGETDGALFEFDGDEGLVGFNYVSFPSVFPRFRTDALRGRPGDRRRKRATWKRSGSRPSCLIRARRMPGSLQAVAPVMSRSGH